ncbi:MAG: hypothetical protein HQ522_07870 [Bacteroidetes bacterium]|nr:hypothetical protein [Bacteroidota bacterium]
MALSGEVLKADGTLQGLSDEQISAIETLSQNDENVVIGKRIGELHGEYDKDVLAVAGVEKNQGEKSYDYVKRVITDFKGKANSSTELNSQIETLQGEISTYKEQIASGKGNEVIAQQLKDAQSKAATLQTQWDADKETWKQKETEFQTTMSTFKINSEFDKALSGIKFKAEYPADIQNVLVESAKSKILNTHTPDWIDDGKGGKMMAFRDAKGEIVRNPENRLNPMSAAELISNQLKNVIDSGKKQTGGGGKEPGGGSDKIELVELTSAKTQIEADTIIVKYLMQNGYTRGTGAFAEKQAEIRKDNSIEKLDMR